MKKLSIAMTSALAASVLAASLAVTSGSGVEPVGRPDLSDQVSDVMFDGVDHETKSRCSTVDEQVRYEQLAMLRGARQAAQEAWSEEEWYYEPYSWELGGTSDYSAPYTAPYDTSDGISASEFQWMGVVEDDGTRYTWYSENVLPGGGLDELNGNGRHVEDGFVKDVDGYIAVASSDHEKGEVIDTPFGEAKVYDTGCASGTVDVYTNF